MVGMMAAGPGRIPEIPCQVVGGGLAIWHQGSQTPQIICSQNGDEDDLQ